jgi:hypothetical protein
MKDGTRKDLAVELINHYFSSLVPNPQLFHLAVVADPKIYSVHFLA